jgi:hypothetical protein
LSETQRKGDGAWRVRIPSVRITRDTISYTIGVLGTIYETVIANGSPAERLPFLVIFVGLITAPAILHKDEKREAKRDEEEEGVE